MWEKENDTRSRVEERGGRERCSPSPLPCLASAWSAHSNPAWGQRSLEPPSLFPLPPVREPQPELWMKLLGLQLLCATVRARNGNRVTVTQQPPWSTPPHTGSLLKGPAGNTAETEGKQSVEGGSREGAARGAGRAKRSGRTGRSEEPNRKLGQEGRGNLPAP